jgi:hypothetical protein
MITTNTPRPLTLIACIMASIAVTGCNGESAVPIKGTVQQSATDASGLPGARVTVRTLNGKVFDETRTASNGDFKAEAPGGDVLHLQVSGEDLVDASFLGICGIDQTCKVEQGAVFGVHADEWQAWQDQFAGCPDLGDGAAVFGEIRFADLTVEHSEDHPLANSGNAFVTTSAGRVVSACFLDEEGLAYDAEAELTGPTGRFLIPGLPSGSHTLTIGYAQTEVGYVYDDYPLWLPEDGLAPRLPAWVRL